MTRLDLEPRATQSARRQRWLLPLPAVASIARYVIWLMLVLVPTASAIAAADIAPPARLTIAGAAVTVRPAFGQDVTRLHAPNLGTMIRPDHTRILGKTIGADITVDASNLPITGGQGQLSVPKIEELGRSFTDLKVESAKVIAAERRQLENWAVGGASLAVSVQTLGFIGLALGRRRLEQYGEQARADIRLYNEPFRLAMRWTAAVAAVSVVGAAGYAVASPSRHYRITPDRALDGTVLAGTEIQGNARPILDTVLPSVVDYLDAVNDFYASASQHQEEALRTALVSLTRGPGVVRFVVADDLQGVSGMARLVGSGAHLVDANFILVTGDTSATGSAWESMTVDALRYYAGRGMQIVAVLGRHDSPATATLMRKAGILVGDNKVHHVQGVSLLLANDPWRSPFGGRSYLIDPAIDTPTAAADLTATACETRPQLAAVHDNAIGKVLAASGCVHGLVLDGRSYALVGPRKYATGHGAPSFEFTSGSTGGHGTGDGPEVGIIHNDAHYVIFDYDKATQTLTYRVVTVTPAAEVTVGQVLNLDGAPVRPDKSARLGRLSVGSH